MKLHKNSFIWIGVLCLAFFAESFVKDAFTPVTYDIFIYAGINIILALSLNLVNGFTGQFSIGHAGFMAVGAYTAGLITMSTSAQMSALNDKPVLFFLFFTAVLIASGLVAAMFGVILGMPTLKLKGDYLAIVTLGFGEIIRVLLLNLDFVGGARGMPGIPKYTNFSWVWFWIVITLFVMQRLVVSQVGRGLKSIREDEIAAESVGINTTSLKIQAFTISAFFAGVAGGLFAHYLTFLTPSIFDFNKSFEVIIMVVLGGMGSLTGSVVAAFGLTYLREWLRDLQQLTQVDLRMIIYSLILIGLMLVKPNGIMGEQEIGDVWKKLKNKFKGKTA